MNDNTTLLLGAVAYDPKVVTIWDGFQRYFARHGLAFDYVLYSNYERQVEAHVRRADSRRLEFAAGVAPMRAHRRRPRAGARKPSACAIRTAT